MHNPTLYRVISHLDAPKRYMSLTLDELLVALLGLMLLVASNHKILVGCLCFGLYGILKVLKQGHGPRYLLVLLYWHMPRAVTQLIVSHLPASCRRVWRA